MDIQPRTVCGRRGCGDFLVYGSHCSPRPAPGDCMVHTYNVVCCIEVVVTMSYMCVCCVVDVGEVIF
jgi:hypothetical protein